MEHPDVQRSRKNLDFGPGFYLTSFREQAERWALRFYEKNDQYCFVTQKAIDGKLSFLEAYEVIR